MSANRAAVDRLRARLAAVSDALREKLRESIRDALAQHIQAQFAAGLDVNGQPWLPRRRRSGGGLALQSLASSVDVQVDGDAIVVTISHPKAKFHQGGWRRTRRRVAARLMMPGRRRVGVEWLKAIRRGADRGLRAAAREGKK